ncbi:hypothetical protein Poly41_39800 [Novipirellula artificiosorum]|uniref:Uncharacterized protein n=1 Tax=Novipirellula artificiosorum TaxID=2528016 RepID=A0A5C6DG83_9BACT|nr:hypothetical protein Poly41_39800 [Novipirellula artificiosorum]
MVMPIPPWIEFIVMGAIGICLIAFLVFLGLFLPWAWSKYFNYLGRNEKRDQPVDASSAKGNRT